MILPQVARDNSTCAACGHMASEAREGGGGFLYFLAEIQSGQF